MLSLAPESRNSSRRGDRFLSIDAEKKAAVQGTALVVAGGMAAALWRREEAARGTVAAAMLDTALVVSAAATAEGVANTEMGTAMAALPSV